MSLLLDALKKAADDKQKAEQSQQAVSEAEAGSVPSAKPPAQESSPQPQDEPEAETAGAQEEELSLSLDALEESPSASAGASTEAGDVQEETADTADTNEVVQEPGIRGQDDEGGASAVTASAQDAGLAISDEALSLLIRKTNHDVKQDRRLWLVGVLLVSLGIIVSAGIYYYLDTQDELLALERRHRIAMQQMQAKTGDENLPQRSDIIRNLVSDKALDDKVKFAKEHMNNKPPQAAGPENATAGDQHRKGQNGKDTGLAAGADVSKAQKHHASARQDKSVLSIERSHRADPVAQSLQTAWQAYAAGRYEQAAEEYRQVLQREPDNRDALLGMGAIALQQQDMDNARAYYRRLLEQDPNDALAIAGLSSAMNTTAPEVTNDHEQYLQERLQKNPGSATLNFALANVYARQEKWQQAQQYYFNAWQSDSDNADYLYNLAVSLDQLGKTEQALGFYRQSLRQASRQAVSYSPQAVEKRVQQLLARESGGD